jgi:hypothetical protein
MRTRFARTRVLAISMVVAAVVGGLAVVELGGSSGAPGATVNPDTITYNQTTGSSGTYINYVPGDGSKATKQSVTSGGGCATPTPSGTPILAFSANYYGSVDGYNGSSTPAVVGAYKSRTGVCQIPQAWSIEKFEQLTFSVGSNSLVAGRLFTNAVIKLEREDKSTSTSTPVAVQFIERNAGTQVGTQSFNINGPNGTQLDAGTGPIAAGFDSLDIRVTSPDAGSISVVGPTSTFTLANKICGGQTINTTSTDGTIDTGQVSVSYTLDAAPTVCKSYTSFAASNTDPLSTDGKSITFLSQHLNGVHVTATFDWGLSPYCRADATVEAGVPACPTTQISLGDSSGPFSPAEYCAAASTAQPFCATSRNINYVKVHDPSNPGADANGDITEAHIVETYDGIVDLYARR